VSVPLIDRWTHAAQHRESDPLTGWSRFFSSGERHRRRQPHERGAVRALVQFEYSRAAGEPEGICAQERAIAQILAEVYTAARDRASWRDVSHPITPRSKPPYSGRPVAAESEEAGGTRCASGLALLPSTGGPARECGTRRIVNRRVTTETTSTAHPSRPFPLARDFALSGFDRYISSSRARGRWPSHVSRNDPSPPWRACR